MRNILILIGLQAAVIGLSVFTTLRLAPAICERTALHGITDTAVFQTLYLGLATVVVASIIISVAILLAKGALRNERRV